MQTQNKNQKDKKIPTFSIVIEKMNCYHMYLSRAGSLIKINALKLAANRPYRLSFPINLRNLEIHGELLISGDRRNLPKTI